MAAPNRLKKDLPDVMEVMDALMAATRIKLKTVEEVQTEKRCPRLASRSRRGGFNNRIKLLWTSFH